MIRGDAHKRPTRARKVVVEPPRSVVSMLRLEACLVDAVDLATTVEGGERSRQVTGSGRREVVSASATGAKSRKTSTGRMVRTRSKQIQTSGK